MSEVLWIVIGDMRRKLLASLRYRGQLLVISVLVCCLLDCSTRTSPSTLVVVPPTTELSVTQDVPEKNLTATTAKVADPSLVWLPFAEGAHGDSPTVLVVRSGDILREPSPVQIHLFWDYSAAYGKLAYASEFWHGADGSNHSVSDLWVYDYTSGVITSLLPDNVARASWSPHHTSTDREARAAVALFDENARRFDLIVVKESGESILVSEYASRFFSWSPDGNLLAFIRQSHPDLSSEDVGLYVVPVDGGETEKISDFSYRTGGWLGDRPVWASGQNALIVADNPLLVVPLDGSGDVTPVSLDGLPIDGPRPDVMLWTPVDRRLVVSGEWMLGDAVWVYSFSDELRTVERSEFLGEGMLVGWMSLGKSVIALGSDGVEVLELPES